jgi:hypothetical protein
VKWLLSGTGYYRYIGTSIITNHIFEPNSYLTKHNRIRLLAVISCSLCFLYSFGQKTDTISPRNTEKISPRKTDTIGRKKADTISRIKRWEKNNIFQFFRNSVTRSGNHDSANLAVVINTKSESPFQAYEGKIIRHIYIKGYGFEQVFTDTTKRLQYNGTKLLNHLHRKTRDWVIRNSLFIKENTVLNPFKLADNERLIRSLEYVQDARILVNYLDDNPDSVDLVVVVKDLFSIGGAVGSVTQNSLRGNVSDANAFGVGQKIQLGSYIEQKRDPHFGYQFLYSKSNISSTFVNATVSYSQVTSDLTDGTPDEQGWLVRLDRPLYAPYAHLAGNITAGEGETFNVYAKPDTFFFKYHYRLRDAWVGWNLGTKRFIANTSVRDRKFLGIRYFNTHFYQTPEQIGNNFNFRFNDRQAVLAQFTFFRQDFYKTNYIYGFGTTEDVPEGYNVAVTSGWYKQLFLERPYAGVDANRYVVSKGGEFVQYFLRSGAFLRHNQVEDASVLIGSSYYSPLFVFKHLKIRQYINFSYSRQWNRLGIDPLTIDNVFGLRYFSGDSTFGYQRITLHSETTFFINFKLLGFKFAPFAFGDLSLLTPEGQDFSKSALYHGIGAGMRTRNENLVFGTIELRAAYFPRKALGNESFKIMLTTGIQFRYNNTYVKAPDIIQLNSDGLNSIY